MKEPIEATCVHIVDQFGSVLLGDQQRGVTGRKGYGGKVENGYSIRDSAVDEVKTETGGIRIKPQHLVPSALIDFYNGTEAEVPFGSPSFRVYFFNCFIYEGQARDTEEMVDPAFYPLDSLPYEEMLPGDRFFIRPTLEGRAFTGWIRLTANRQSLIDYGLSEIDPKKLTF